MPVQNYVTTLPPPKKITQNSLKYFNFSTSK